MMNVMNSALLSLLLLAGCSASAPEAPPLAGAKIGGPFTLVSEDGRTVSDQAFAGQNRLVYFGYSYCPDVCPVDVRNLMLGMKALETSDPTRAASIQPLFITVDPARDTPAVLTEFTDAFHPRLIGLTGSEAQIAATAKAFAIAYKKGESAEKGAYLVGHSRIAMLFGKKGEPLAIIAHDAAPDEIAAELARWAQ